jgi:hypothetical protein
MLEELIALANYFDSKGMTKEADFIDYLLTKESALRGNLQDISSEIDNGSVESFKNYISEKSKDIFGRKDRVSPEDISIRKMKSPKTQSKSEFSYCIIKCCDKDCINKMHKIIVVNKDKEALSLLEACCNMNITDATNFNADDEKNIIFFSKMTSY